MKRSLGIAAVVATLVLAHAATARGATPVPASAPTLEPERVVPDRYARGQILTIGHGYVVFTTGDALRLRPGTLVPKGTTVGSLVRVTIDQLARDVKTIELSPRVALEGEIDATSLGREYVVVHSVRNVPIGETSASASASASAAAAPNQTVTITLVVNVPANTPLADDVYVATERTGFEPSEVRMERVDARRFTVPLSLPLGGRLRYQYTRGTNATVERERSGDIAKQRDLVAAPSERIEDTVPRWADLT